MARKTKCQTPGAVFSSRINGALRQVHLTVQLPPSVPLRSLTKDEARLLEDNLHNAAELVLAPFFTALAGMVYCPQCGARVGGPVRDRNPHSDGCVLR